MNGAGAIGVPDRQWTTAGAPAAEQVGLWQQAVDEAFVPAIVRARRHESFVSEVAVHSLGGIEVADIASPPQSVTRTAAQASGTPAGVFFLNLPLSVGATVTQRGRTERLSVGDFVLVDGDVPFELDFTSRFRQISLKIPRELLEARLVRAGEVAGVRVPCDHGVGAVASAAILAASGSAGSLERRSARELGHRIADLVALALGGVRPQTPHASGALLFRAALDEAERRLADPCLGPGDVAARVGISTRYLHRLFSDNGPSFGRWLLARRLELACDDLADPTLARRTVGRIAADCGFDDPSYFSRAFRVHYGLTPRAFRALHDASGRTTGVSGSSGPARSVAPRRPRTGTP